MQPLMKRTTLRTMTAALAATTVLAVPAIADEHMMGATYNTGTVNEQVTDNLIRARDITGGNIYAMTAEPGEAWDENMMYGSVDAEWDVVGEIEDIVLSPDGQMTGIIAEVGGFLDIADTHVLIRLDDVRLVQSESGDYAYVTHMTLDELENLKEVDDGWWS
jgi:hypothetical protein